MVRMTERISEQAFLIGKQKSLVGIVTRIPLNDPTERPAVVILNTGIIHRVGHNRMYVDLSRILARAGHTVLRFDFSGIGDSESRADALPPWESVFSDIAEVLDWMESTHGIRRVILMGLCSGADHALYYGSSDDRVVGLVLMNPTIPPTPKHYLHYFGRRMFRVRSWLNAAMGRARAWTMLGNAIWNFLPKPASVKSETSVDPQSPAFLSPAFFEDLYQRSVARDIHFLVILTAGQDTRYTYREQLLDAFPNVSFRHLLRLKFLDDCDHTFLFESNRAQLTDLVLGWVRETPFSKPRKVLPWHSATMSWFVWPGLCVRLSVWGLFSNIA